MFDQHVIDLRRQAGDNSEIHTLNRLIRDVFLVIWTLILFVKITIHVYYSPKTENISHKPLRYASLVTIGSLFIGFIFSIIELFTIEAIRSVYYLALNCAFIASYTMVLLQLYYSFKSSIYKIPNKTFYFHFILGLLCEFFFILSAILDYFRIHPWKLYIQAIAGICFLIGVFQITFSFNRKLVLVILSQRRPTVHKQSSEYKKQIELGIEAKVSLSDRQLSVLQTIVKHTVLSSFEIGCYLFLCIVVVIAALIDPDRKYEIGSIIRMWCFALAIIVVTICIYLSFVIHNDQYYKICGKCDNCCRFMCERLATSSIERQERMEQKKRARVSNVEMADV